MLLNYLFRINRKWNVRVASRFLWNNFYNYPESVKWLHYIDQLYKNQGFDSAPILIVRKKCYKKYLSRSFKFSERMKVIEEHYALARQLFSLSFYKSILAMQETLLATVSGKSGKSYGLFLAQNPELCSEGELSIYLREHDAAKNLATLTFVLSPHVTGTKMIIGGLQGPRGQTTKSDVVFATRDLFGLRPKNAVIAAVYGICAKLNVSQIEAIGRVNNPSKRIGTSFLADNDSFWSEFGVENAITHNFDLPLIPQDKTIEEVATKKKKLWLARQKLKKAIMKSADLNFVRAMQTSVQ